jgi:hypothetical protein
MRFFRRHGRALRRRYGHAGGKRSEGVHVKREPGRLYYVAGSGEVMSAPMKKHH